MEIFSKKTRNEFREFFVNKTIREIQSEFDAVNIFCDLNYVPEVLGQRRFLVEQYYHSIDWANPADALKVQNLYETTLVDLEDLAENGAEWAIPYFRQLKKWVERDGFVFESGKLKWASSCGSLHEIAKFAGNFDIPQLKIQIQRINSSIDEDPSLAIGTAKELVETICKTILGDRKIVFTDDMDVGLLVKLARKELDIIPESISDSIKGADIIKRLLSNLGNVAQGLAELRNLYGTGHGRRGSNKGLNARHARLAVGSATTLALFLYETHLERKL